MPVDQAVTIGRLRVRTSDGADPAARLRAEAAVSRLELHPPGLSRHAILVVRRLMWDGADSARARLRMGELARDAGRPVLGPVPPGAEAVLFVDEAELLACLTADLVEGRARERWWWARLPATSTMAAAWRERVPVLPAAMALLAPAVLRRAAAGLAPSEVQVVLSELRANHGLAAFDGRAAGPIAGGGAEPAAVAWDAPWRPWLAEEDPALPLAPCAELLVGVALGIHHAPAVTRSPSFADAARRWLRRAEAKARPPVPAVGDGAGAEETLTPAPGRAPISEVAGEATVSRLPFPPSPPAWPASSASPVARHREKTSSLDGPALGRPGDAVTPVHAPCHAEPEGLFASPSSVQTSPASIDTQLGGVLYLVNVVSRLGLFTWEAPTLGGWAVVEGVARLLLGDQPVDPDGRDPIWTALAELDGREPGEPIGAGVAAAVPWEAGPPGEGMALDGLATPPAARWLVCAAALVVAHLEPAELAAGWLRVAGRLEIGRTHVELVASMSAIDVAVRRSGLDRDPGWVPELGRIVLFHFEDHG